MTAIAGMGSGRPSSCNIKRVMCHGVAGAAAGARAPGDRPDTVGGSLCYSMRAALSSHPTVSPHMRGKAGY